ncbi:hypothetical protein [Croceibacterium ferulae]|uniref:hypothetical protein n=1 Tax=Croceibacterium ferulae TaxID=1854641 RepID=UPI000F860D72|nr:hypothetical protein [Croceibacterium ferulae]
MPSRSSTLWTLTALLILAYPALNFVYWPEARNSGILPADGDSIDIPMFGSLLVTLIASAIVLGVAWLCFRRYNPSTRLLAFRLDRPYRSFIATVVFGVSAAILCLGALVDTIIAMPWYEYLRAEYMMLAAAWLLTLRTSWIDQRTAEEAEAEQLR